MKQLWRLILILFITLSQVNSLSAQPREYSTTNKKAIKSFEEGLAAYRRMNLDLAMANFNVALEKDPNFVEAHMMKSQIYQEKNDIENSIKSLQKAIALRPAFFPNNFFSLAQMELDQGHYKEAKLHYEHFLSFPNIHPELANQAKKDIVNCEFAIKAVKNPVPFDPVNLGSAINSANDEYFPCLTADDQTILYTRQLTAEIRGSHFNEDFYMGVKKKDQWLPSFNLGLPINTQNNEGAPTLSADGQILIFTACALYGSYGPGRKGYGSCDLFVSQKVGDRWTKPANLGPPINTGKWETQPSLSADGRTLYFVRGTVTRSGIQGQDIFVTQIDENGRWSEPSPVSPNINTPEREESVFIHPDGKTLYFSSDGHPGMGGLDIYLSKKDSSGQWSKAQNLGYPINTAKHENSLLVDAAGKLAYFASNREGGLGGLDLYSFVLPESVKPQLVTYLKGKVFDKVSKDPLESKFELIDLETGTIAVESYSNKGNGEFLVALPTDRNYALNVSKNGYLFYSENFSLQGNSEAGDPFYKDVPLQPIQVGEKVILRNIFFETDKYDLKAASKVELEKLIDFLKKNPGIRIELSGHTDHVGDDQYNLELSTNRAKSVYNYLIDHSIAKDRLSFKGYGETQPVAGNDTESGRAQNRRTEFKIISKE